VSSLSAFSILTASKFRLESPPALLDIVFVEGQQGIIAEEGATAFAAAFAAAAGVGLTRSRVICLCI